jgi:Fic family protein
VARPQTQWPEIVFVGEVTRAALSKAAAEGRLVRIGSGIYSGRPLANQSDVALRNWHQILSHELPGAIVTDRSARRRGPDNGLLTVIHQRDRPLVLPGLTILPRPGEGPLPGDVETDGIWFASEARAMLENIRSRRNRRYMDKVEIEAWITDIIATGGERHLNFIRDSALTIARKAGWTDAYQSLSAIIGAALSTQPADSLKTPALQAHAAGKAYDHHRLALFERFASALSDIAPDPLPEMAEDSERRRLQPFYEAYFSNYIEGTEFTLDEAAAIVYDADIPAGRPEDAHDILGTYRLVSDPIDRRRTPSDPADLLALLVSRHTTLMEGRPEKRPGQFKTRANRAGGTQFVAPNLAAETLRRAFDAGGRLIDPLARAAFISFVVAEVHPFDDGNGRISRVMMNAEMSANGEGRILIPTVYRNNYLAGLRGASHNDNFASFLAILRFAQRFTARIDFSDRKTAEAELARTNAFRDSTEADEAGIRLQMPS